MPHTTPANADDLSWMDDLYTEPAAPAAAPAVAPQQQQHSAPLAPAYQAQPQRPQAPQQPYPDVAALVHSRAAAQGVVNPPAAAPAAPAAQPPAPPRNLFNDADLVLTAAEQAQLAASGAAPLLEKVARRAVAEYDRSVGDGLRNQVTTLEQQQRQREAEVTRVEQTANARALQARFPDLDQMRQRPEWASFADTPVMTPAGYVPRQVALSMAAENGNYAYIDSELAAFRTQNAPSAGAFGAVPDASGGFAQFPQQGNAMPQAPQPPNRMAPQHPASTAPTLAQLSQGARTLSLARVQSKLQELSTRISLNPRDEEAKSQYNVLSNQARQAHFEGRLV